MTEKSFETLTIPEPLTRSYRRFMKPRLPRKITASARINLNRFWNELEEFYNRYDARSEKPVVKMPQYTTDTFDHKREEAENNLNEEIDQGKTLKVLNSTRQRLQSDDVDFEVSSCSSEDEGISEEVFLWNVHEKSTPRPPKTLLDLIHRFHL